MSMQGFRGNCDSKGKLGMCPSLAESDSGGIPRRELLLEKPVFPVRQKGVPPLLLPSSVLQLPRCLARTYNLDSYYSTLFELDSFKRCNCSRENRLQSLICFANVGYSPTPRQHFCKTAAPKNFSAACGSYLSTKTKKQADMLLRISCLLLFCSKIGLFGCLLLFLRNYFQCFHTTPLLPPNPQARYKADYRHF